MSTESGLNSFGITDSGEDAAGGDEADMEEEVVGESHHTSPSPCSQLFQILYLQKRSAWFCLPLLLVIGHLEQRTQSPVHPMSPFSPVTVLGVPKVSDCPCLD